MYLRQKKQKAKKKKVIKNGDRKKQQEFLQRMFKEGCEAYELPEPQCEYEIKNWVGDRCGKCKADFAFPDAKLVVEIEGGHFSKVSGHSGGVAIRKDLRRFNLLTELGWRYLRYPIDKFPNVINLVNFDQVKDVYELLKKEFGRNIK